MTNEKQLQIDAEQIIALQKQNGELTDKVADLKEEINKIAFARGEADVQLTKAKKIIKTLLRLWTDVITIETEKALLAEAENFLKETN